AAACTPSTSVGRRTCSARNPRLWHGTRERTCRWKTGSPSPAQPGVPRFSTGAGLRVRRSPLLPCAPGCGRATERREPLSWILTPLENFDESRTHDNTIHMATQPLDLLTAAYPETGAHRPLCQRAYPIQIVHHLGWNGDVPAGRSGHRNRINETLAGLTELAQPLWPGNRGDHLHHRDT